VIPNLFLSVSFDFSLALSLSQNVLLRLLVHLVCMRVRCTRLRERGRKSIYITHAIRSIWGAVLRSAGNFPVVLDASLPNTRVSLLTLYVAREANKVHAQRDSKRKKTLFPTK
jgi:hypothetical protein